MDRKDEGGARKMKRLPFLNQAEIRTLQDQEVQSDKVQRTKVLCCVLGHHTAPVAGGVVS